MDLKKITKPTNLEMLIVFTDLRKYTKLASSQSPMVTFKYISKIYEIIGDYIEPAGGSIIKFIGDASLSIFDQENINDKIKALVSLKEAIDQYNEQNYIDSKIKICAHIGNLTIGFLGTQTDKKLDIIGNEVNVCAQIKTKGFAVTKTVFYKLNDENRNLFNVHSVQNGISIHEITRK